MLDNVRVTAGGDARPTITAQPQSVTAPVGTSATFSVTATGQAPLSYQWRINGSAIAGATASRYTTRTCRPRTQATTTWWCRMPAGR